MKEDCCEHVNSMKTCAANRLKIISFPERGVSPVSQVLSTPKWSCHPVLVGKENTVNIWHVFARKELS